MTLWLLYRRMLSRISGLASRSELYPCVSVCVISVYRKAQIKVMEVTTQIVGVHLRILITSPSDCPGIVTPRFVAGDFW